MSPCHRVPPPNKWFISSQNICLRCRTNVKLCIQTLKHLTILLVVTDDPSSKNKWPMPTKNESLASKPLPFQRYMKPKMKGLSLSKVCMWRHQIIPEWHDVMLYRCWYWWQMDADFTLVFVSACIKINIASIHKHCLHHPCLSCYVIMIFVFISEKCQNVRHMQTVDWLRQEKTIHSQEDFSKV